MEVVIANLEVRCLFVEQHCRWMRIEKVEEAVLGQVLSNGRGPGFKAFQPDNCAKRGKDDIEFVFANLAQLRDISLDEARLVGKSGLLGKSRCLGDSFA